MRALGIDFFQGSVQQAAEKAFAGGLTVAPSGPNLADLDRMPAYQRALSEADLIVVDSGFLALCWKRKTGQPMTRISGLNLLETILASESFLNAQKQLWVMPTKTSIDHAKDYLSKRGVHLPNESFYEAPMYSLGEIEDHALLARIREQQSEFILINVAGSKQEVLGAWLKRELDYKPPIVCTGAAIAFLTGEQANIPTWGDRLYLGWLLRILHCPKRYLPRYWEARRLWRLVKIYGDQAPVQTKHVTD